MFSSGNLNLYSVEDKIAKEKFVEKFSKLENRFNFKLNKKIYESQRKYLTPREAEIIDDLYDAKIYCYFKQIEETIHQTKNLNVVSVCISMMNITFEDFVQIIDLFGEKNMTINGIMYYFIRFCANLAGQDVINELNRRKLK
jgi:hypothetical protein